MALLIAQEFPQVPVKPLSLITRAPDHRHLLLASPHGPVVVDLFLPRPWLGDTAEHSRGAIILAFGVKVPPSAKQDVLRLADTLARLGYVAMWPRLRPLDEGAARLEEPDTFRVGFSYLARVPAIDPRRISYFGISVGASIAFVAAATPPVVHRVHAFVFFGGYYDIDDYLVSLATGEDRFEGREVRWQPSRDAVRQVRAILRQERATRILRLFDARTPAATRRLLAVLPGAAVSLRRFNPSSFRRTFEARIFILHDRSDQYVPYVESEKLNRALPKSVSRTLLITDVFKHVEPGGGSIGQLVQLYQFAYAALDAL